MKMTYNQISQSAGYREDDIGVTLSVCGGSYGGGSEVLVAEYISDDPTPKFGGALQILSKQKDKGVS